MECLNGDMHFDHALGPRKVFQGLTDGMGTSQLVLSEISTLFLMTVSPEMGQRWNSTHVGRNHFTRDISL